MSFENDSPPTSKDEAVARCVRPPPEKYDPDSLSHWSITMMVAWIIWRVNDAVRNEWDDYRNDCADWAWKPTARAKLVIPELQEVLKKESQWHLDQWRPSGWDGLRSRARSENPQAAIDLLWRAAGEDIIRATALECRNAKAFDGGLIEIPAHYWPRLKPDDDRLTGKAMLSGPDGRVYREVKFRRVDGKNIWPKSPPLPEEALQNVEKSEQPAAPKKEPKDWLVRALKEYPQQRNERPTAYTRRLHGLMQAADNVTKVWSKSTLRVRYYEAVKSAVQKKRKSPRTF